MKIVIAPDSFKESLTAMQVATAIEQGFKQIFPDAEYIKVPMADGGEGTVESMIDATKGQRVELNVTGPLGQPVAAFFGLLGDGKSAVIEMAAASGLHHVAPELRNPLHTTSYGTGELLLAALDQGVDRVILGVGGSATNDGGVGMMQALGAVFTDAEGKSLSHNGGALTELVGINLSGLDSRLARLSITVACDVNNPLCGANGASAIFGPQKGATPAMVELLDKALYHYGMLVEKVTGRSVVNVAGAGAAGGMGAALLGLLGAELKPGVEIVIDALKLADAIRDADLVITGEGRIDSQTITGKTPIGVARVAKRFNKVVIGLAGGLTEDHGVVHEHGLDAVFCILQRITSLAEALSSAEDNLRITSRNIAMVWKMSAC